MASDFEVFQNGPVATVVFPTEIDLSNVGALNQAFEGAMDTTRGNIVVSMTDVEYFDTTTINRLIRWVDVARSKRRRVTIVRPKSRTGRRILDLLGLHKKWALFDTVEDATRAFESVLA